MEIMQYFGIIAYICKTMSDKFYLKGSPVTRKNR